MTVGETILVVEDEVLVRMDISQTLRNCGYNVLEASRAEEAIEILRSGASVQLVFTDLRMPGKLDGLDVARYASENCQLPVVIGSGHAVPSEIPEALGPVISKPYPMETLLREIGHKLREHVSVDPLVE